MKGIIDKDGRPLTVAERQPIRAKHITRQAIWTQETERVITKEHSPEGHHDSGWHLVGYVWLRYPEGPLDLEISPGSFWRDRVQDEDGGPWSGEVNMLNTREAILELDGDQLDGTMAVCFHARSFRSQYEHRASWTTGYSQIGLFTSWRGQPHHNWNALLIYGK